MSKERPINGEEFDWCSGWRRITCWYPGQGKAIKRRMNKRSRRRAKVELSRGTDGG